MKALEFSDEDFASLFDPLVTQAEFKGLIARAKRKADDHAKSDHIGISVTYKGRRENMLMTGELFTDSRTEALTAIERQIKRVAIAPNKFEEAVRKTYNAMTRDYFTRSIDFGGGLGMGLLQVIDTEEARKRSIEDYRRRCRGDDRFGGPYTIGVDRSDRPDRTAIAMVTPTNMRDGMRVTFHMTDEPLIIGESNNFGMYTYNGSSWTEQTKEKPMTELQKSADKVKILACKLGALEEIQENGFEKTFTLGNANYGGTTFDTRGCGVDPKAVETLAAALNDGIKKSIAAELATMAKLIGPTK